MRQPAAGSLTLTGLAPTVEITHIRQPGTGSLTITGQQPTRQTGDNVVRSPNNATLALTGRTPTVEITHVREPANATLTLTGLAPQVRRDVQRLPAEDSLILTGLTPTSEITHVRQPGVGSLSLTGQQPTRQTGDNVVKSPNNASLALTGLAPTREISPVRAPAAGSISLVGLAPTLKTNYFIQPGTGSLAITGQTPIRDIPSTPITRSPGTGSLAVTGLAPKRGVGLRITGLQPTVKFNQHLPKPAAGSLALTGQQATILADMTLLPATANLNLTGQQPAIDNVFSKNPAQDDLAITGYAPSIQIKIEISVPVGSLTISGQLLFEETINPPRGQIQFFGWRPSRPYGLRLTGFDPIVDLNPIGSFTERPANDQLNITGYQPTIIQTGVVSTRLPASASLTISEQIPAIVTDIANPASSLILSGFAPRVRYNFHDPLADNLVLTGHIPTLDLSYISTLPGNLAITSHAPTYLIQEGDRTITPGKGSLAINGLRPRRVTGTSAQITINGDAAASGGRQLFRATITISGTITTTNVGNAYCRLTRTATVSIAGSAQVAGSYGALKTRQATVNINTEMSSPSLYWISDGTNLLGRASIQL